MKRLCLSFIVIEFIFSYCLADTIIQMEEYNGVYKIPCTVNGAKMKFIFDTGASNVCLSLSMAEYLYDNGYITNNDIIGEGQTSVADGRIVDHIIVNIRDLEISGCHLQNVEAVVLAGQNTPLLMGQSAIQKLGAIELNGSILIIHNEKNDDYDTIIALLADAEKSLEDGLYDRAESKYQKLFDMKQLSDQGIYTYATVCFENEKYDKAFDIINTIQNIDSIIKNNIDVYQFIGNVYTKLEKYSIALKYYEKSNETFQNDCFRRMQNYEKIAYCYAYLEKSKLASEYYWKALEMHAKICNVDMDYIKRDCKNKLKKNEKSYRSDLIDYIMFYALYYSQQCGYISNEKFLVELTAIARAGNKNAMQSLNRLGINPYDRVWR